MKHTQKARSSLRPARQFRPGTLMTLEGRIALSSFAHAVHAEHAIVVEATTSPSILSSFPREAAGLAAGNTVYERWTTTYYSGLTQIDNESFVLSNQTVTVTENITLPGAAGTETAVDHFTAIAGGVLFQNTVTEPNGQTETETRADIFDGPRKIFSNGTIVRPDGVTIAFTGNSTRTGARTVVNKSFQESNGISYTTHEVDVVQGEWQSSATVTTKWLDGSHQLDKDTAYGVQLAAPAS